MSKLTDLQALKEKMNLGGGQDLIDIQQEGKADGAGTSSPSV